MAEQIIVNRTDDIDGTPADTTILFSFDGNDYIIDLNAENARTLRDVFGDWTSHARLANGTVHGNQARPRTPASRERAKAIRTWAHHRGLPVKDKGRISDDIAMQYDNRLGAN
jgi:hypothetical protein